MIKKLLIALIICIGVQCIYAQNKRVVCYYTNWSQYRDGAAKFFPENIDPNLCTHIMYAFAKLENNQLAPFEWNDDSTDWSKGLYARATDLKLKNPSLKISLAVGGWNMGVAPFKALVATDATIDSFVTSTVAFLKARNFDGLDLDWEYPDSTMKARFTVLCQKLSVAFKQNSLLLSAAIGAGKATIDNGYDIPAISKHLDFINLMTYDFHGSWDTVTGFNAPLYERPSDQDKTFNVDYAARYVVSLGCPKSKLNVGLGTYGRSFTLSTSSNSVGDPISAGGLAGPYTREAGFLAYYEICDKLKSGWTRVWDDQAQVPYAYSGNQWVGYDDLESISVKANYIMSQDFGGAMFWAVDLDDFSNSFCGQGQYPIINKVKSILSSGSPSTTTAAPFTTSSPGTTTTTTTTTTSSSQTTTRAPSTTTTTSRPATTTTTRAPATTTTTSGSTASPSTTSSPNLCWKGDGYNADVASGCTKYYNCVFTGTVNQQIYYFNCPAGLLFDSSINACNYPSLVTCA